MRYLFLLKPTHCSYSYEKLEIKSKISCLAVDLMNPHKRLFIKSLTISAVLLTLVLILSFIDNDKRDKKA